MQKSLSRQCYKESRDEDIIIENLLEGLEISTSANDAVCPVCGTIIQKMLIMMLGYVAMDVTYMV